MPPVVIHGEDVDVAAIQAAIRERVAPRRMAGLPVAAAEVAAAQTERVAGLARWNLPAATWEAMYPPNLTAWNLDDDFPIRSHRSGIGSVLVGGKRLLLRLLRVVLRPILAQQVEINRALSLMTVTLAEEAARERLHLRALEARIARVGAGLREVRGDAEPLVVFADDGPRTS